ncbi:MAG: nucleotide exchange factor GrpE [Treponema sp.]
MGKHNKHEQKKAENINNMGDKIDISVEATEASKEKTQDLKKEDVAFTVQEQNVNGKIENETSKTDKAENVDMKNKLEQEKKELEDEVVKWKNEYLRKMADFDNYRKRMIKEKKDAIDYANETLLLDLVHVLDDFDRAIEAVEKYSNDATKAFMEGFNMIRKQLYSTLQSKYSLNYYQSVGEKFDPNIHDARGSREDEKVEEEIVEKELIKGYKLHDRVIRVAQVETVKPKKDETK